MNQEKIGKFIAECRKAKNITQQVLAEKLGVSDKTISWATKWGGVFMNNIMEYKGYIGSVEFSEADGLFFGKMEEAVKENKVVSIGVSNFNIHDLENIFFLNY